LKKVAFVWSELFQKLMLLFSGHAVVAVEEEEKQTRYGVAAFLREDILSRKFKAGVMEWKLLISTC
jgi:hypothetical protein